MEYKALAIKNWIISKISPMGWSMVISRSMPEIFEYNPDFSAFYINKRTLWGETEVKIVRIYLSKMYNVDLPDEILDPKETLPLAYTELISVDFFTKAKITSSIKNRLKTLYKYLSI